jgi:hypothetical protein
MSPVELLLDRLQDVQETRKDRWRAKCPAHESRSRTLAIREADTGAALIHCFAGCGAVEVVSAVDLELSDLYPKDDVIHARRYDTTSRKNYQGKLLSLTRAATIVQIAAENMARSENLSQDDLGALRAACDEIRRAVA